VGARWQYMASSRLEQHYRETCVLLLATPPAAALLRSQSGLAAASHLTAIPTRPELVVPAPRMKILLLRRLRCPLPFTAREWNGKSCRGELDQFGDHRSACSAAGRIKWRATPYERMLARVCREGGARVKTNVLVRELNVPHVRPEDGRRIEVIAEGTPLYGGSQIAIDAALVSPLSRSGEPKFNSHAVDGAALKERTEDKETKDYADVFARTDATS